jgi:hypothetical protein
MWATGIREDRTLATGTTWALDIESHSHEEPFPDDS